ncbi:MAG: hypothetical protein Q8R36_00365 [bacterium]|nr:hypothetical protein [bacterium]
MNLDRLRQILRETTAQLRKGEEIEGDPELANAVKNFKEGDDVSNLPGGSVHIYAMPHESQAKNGIEKVDCHFITVGVDKAKAETHRAELVAILNEWPSEAWGGTVPKLEEGPSYIHVGGVIGDQGAAFQLFALGKVLGLWDIITPATLGITGLEADQMAGSGLVMTSGFKAA